MAAIVGHTASPFLKFKGGKGVSTTVGVVLGVWPYFTITGIIALSVFGIVLMLTRYMSVGSMAGAVAIPVAYLALAVPLGWDPFGKQLPLLLFAIVVAALIVYRHRGNIARFGFTAYTAEPATGYGTVIRLTPGATVWARPARNAPT